jgi:hypothetical protein
MKAPVPSDSCPQNPVRTFSPIAASEKTRNGIMIDVRKKSLAKNGIGDECDQQDCRKTDPVLTDRQERLIRLVTCLELASFAIKHVGPSLKSAR